MASKRKMKELRDESIKDLQAGIVKLDQEIFELRNDLSLNKKIEKPHRLKQKRREKARILTVLTLKQQSQSIVKGT